MGLSREKEGKRVTTKKKKKLKKKNRLATGTDIINIIEHT